jgi:cytochrome c-type biogenesis protein CcmH
MSPGRRIGWPTAAFAAAVLVAGAALTVVAARGSPPPRTLEGRMQAVAATLRCPVCQNLSVADSPSRLAQQMRTTISQELAAGRSPDQIRREFVAAYGEWILLAPPKRGIDLLAWIVPILLVVGGVAGAAVAVFRWTRGSQPGYGEPNLHLAAPSLPPADRALLDQAVRAAAEEPE